MGTIGTTVSAGTRRRYGEEDLRDQYARLCALGDEACYKERYKCAREDFSRLIKLGGLASVGIDWERKTLVLGTACVCVRDADNTLRELGHYIVMIQQKPSGYGITNVTRVVDAHPHPHVYQSEGVFCMEHGREKVMNSITDGRYSIAVQILFDALWMRRDRVRILHPISPLSNWPKAQV